MSRRNSFFDEVRKGTPHVEIISVANRYRLNYLTVGPTGSGKTTFSNGVMDDWREQTPGDRVIVIEDTEELQCSLANQVSMRTVVDVADEAKLLKTTLRLVPKRIVVGEVRGPNRRACCSKRGTRAIAEASRQFTRTMRSQGCASSKRF